MNDGQAADRTYSHHQLARRLSHRWEVVWTEEGTLPMFASGPELKIIADQPLDLLLRNKRPEKPNRFSPGRQGRGAEGADFDAVTCSARMHGPMARSSISTTAMRDTVSSGRARAAEERAPGAPVQPVVLVGGFLLPPTADFDSLYWGEALECSPACIIPVHPSPIASLHDRVCQIFYELKGGAVMYGKEHSHEYGHDCVGEVHEQGLYPQWDEEHPVHLVGHSFGGVTVRLLLHYLSNNLFEGHETSAAWITSVITINTPHNGTRLVYGLGADPVTPPLVHWGSVGHMLSFLAHVVEFLDMDVLTRVGLGFGLGYWGWSRRRGFWRGAARVLQVALGYSSLGTTLDNAAFDMTIHAAKAYNAVMTTHEDVFFMSFVGTRPAHPASHSKGGAMAMVLKGLAYRLMGWHVSSARCHEHAVCQDFPPLDDWCKEGESDGIVSTFSQAYPRLPHEAPHEDGLPLDLQDLRPGRWYVTHAPVDHVGIVGFPPSREFQATFFRSLFEVLAACEEHRRRGNTGDARSSSSSSASKRNYPWSSVMAALDGCSSSGSTSPSGIKPIDVAAILTSNKTKTTPTSQSPPSVGSSPPTILTAFLMVTWLLALSIMLYEKPIFLASLSVAVLCFLLRWGSTSVVAPPSISPRGRAVWGLHLIGFLHAVTSSIVGVFLLLTEAQLLSVMTNTDTILTMQLLVSCGFFIFNLFFSLQRDTGGDDGQRRRWWPLAYQALLLTLYTICLHRGLHLQSEPEENALSTTEGATTLLRHLLLLTIFSEAHTATILGRDLLLVSDARSPLPPSPLLPFLWVAVWFTFFLCQTLPLFLFLTGVLTRLIMLEEVLLLLLPSPTSSSIRWCMAAAVASCITLGVNLDSLKHLSRGFQVDCWDLHVATTHRLKAASAGEVGSST